MAASVLSTVKPSIPFSQFAAVEFCIGKIIGAETFAQARNPSYKVTVDFGTKGTKRSSAQLPYNYKLEGLVEKYVVCVTNLAPRRIAGFSSEILIVGFPDDKGHVYLLNTRNRSVQLGLHLSTDDAGVVKPQIVYDTFASADVRCATITGLTVLSTDSSSYRATLDLGELGPRETVITDIDSAIAEEIAGTQVPVLINLKKECRFDPDHHVLAFSHEGKNIPFGVDARVENGVALF